MQQLRTKWTSKTWRPTNNAASNFGIGKQLRNIKVQVGVLGHLRNEHKLMNYDGFPLLDWQHILLTAAENDHQLTFTSSHRKWVSNEPLHTYFWPKFWSPAAMGVLGHI